jgi:hypothetical protein
MGIYDFDLLTSDLVQSQLIINPPSDVMDPFDCYNKMLHQLLDKHALLHQVKVRARTSARWFDAECHSTEAATWKLEKIYRQTCSKQTKNA